MSIEIIRTQLKRFLKSDVPEVLAIRGAWGVGKTFAWNKFLKEAKDSNEISLGGYSYVSLFGINSLDELKLSVFMEIISKQHIGTPQNKDIVASTDKVISALSRKSIEILKGLPFSKNLWPTIQSLSFYTISKNIICIDDFERKGKLLDAQDIMGLVSYLKEQKRCKIVIILNDESLENASLIDYKKYREKVIDIELVFKPSASESAEIALLDDELSKKLKSSIISLKLNNIRIIKKIQRLGVKLYYLLTGYEDEVINQVMHSLALLTCCFYSDATYYPNYDFVKNHNIGLLDFGDDEKKESDQVKKWKFMLREYGYYNTDELDLEVANAVEHGYINETTFLEQAKIKNDEFISSKSVESFSSIWRSSFHNTFEDNEDELVDKLYKNFTQNAKYISVVNLDGTVQLFRQLGRDQLADEIIDLYISEKTGEKKIFALNKHPFRGDIKDNKLKDKFAAVYETQKEIRTLIDVLEKLSDRDGWGQDDEHILSHTTPEEYYALFKSENGLQLSSYIDTCLKFGQFGNATEQQMQIAKNATIALKRIGRESTLNALRIATYGIKPEENEEAAHNQEDAPDQEAVR